MKTHLLCAFAALTAMDAGATNLPNEEALTGAIRVIRQPAGKDLSYSTRSGVKILTIDGMAFKDLNGNGVLDVYEDWRLPYEERAKDLAAQLSIEEIAGLMLYSSHQAIPAPSGGFGAAIYNGLPFDSSGADPSDLTEIGRASCRERV